jgi:hypothetical protein
MGWKLARRFGCDLDGLIRISAAAQACADYPAFVAAAPERQAHAE